MWTGFALVGLFLLLVIAGLIIQVLRVSDRDQQLQDQAYQIAVLQEQVNEARMNQDVLRTALQKANAQLTQAHAVEKAARACVLGLTDAVSALAKAHLDPSAFTRARGDLIVVTHDCKVSLNG